MKLSRSTLAATLAATLATLALATTTVAQPPEGRGRGRGDGGGNRGGGAPGEGMMRFIPVLAALDADKDGVLSKAEIQNATKALMTLDKDNDGSLSAEEMRPAMAMRGGGGNRPDAGSRPEMGDRPDMRRNSGDGMVNVFTDRDADKDGKLSGDEIPPALAQRLEKIDTNKDDAIDRAELVAAMRRLRDAGGNTGRPGGDRGGRPGGDRPKRPSDE
ncbi:MAG: hypothetical protein WBD31_22420 [Rubripirellula sp.]